MEVSEVRKRLRDVVDRSHHAAAERRARNELAGRDWQDLRERTAVPLCRLLVQALRADGYPFQVATPGDAVRLVSEKSAGDVIELSLDTTGAEPVLVCRTNRVRGREILSDERLVAPGGAIAGVTEERLLELLLDVLPPFVER